MIRAEVGWRELEAAMKRRVALTRQKTEAARDASADELVKDMQARVPVRKGDLRDSIRSEKSGGSVAVKAGGTAATARPGRSGTYDEARLTEFGTQSKRHRQAPEPFFRPAVDHQAAPYREAQRKAVSDSLGD